MARIACDSFGLAALSDLGILDWDLDLNIQCTYTIDWPGI